MDSTRSTEPTRSESTLSLPDEGRDFVAFPHRSFAARCPRWYRAHDTARQPWWFSSESGRFDLSHPRGTLNAASSPECAARESLGRVLWGSPSLPESAIDGRTVSCLELPAVQVADFNCGEAASYGIVPGDVTGPLEDGYTITQTWAKVMDLARFDGIIARSRFAPGAAECLFLFGPAGEHVKGATLSSETRTLRAIVSTMPGYSIERTPSSDELCIEE